MKMPLTTKSKKILILVTVMIMISSCTSTSDQVIKPISQPELGYPGIQNEAREEDAYPIGKFIPTLGEGELPEIPDSIPVPEQGKGSIGGVLYSYITNSIIAETQFYLTPAQGAENGEIPLVLIGPNPNNGDLVEWSNTKGQIILQNVPPGKYYLAIWAPMTWVAAETEAMDGTLRLIDISEGQILNLGILYASWP